MTDTSSEKPKFIESKRAAILLPPFDNELGPQPEKDSYITAWENLLAEAARKARKDIKDDPPLDILGNKRKDRLVPVKTTYTPANDPVETDRKVLLFRETNLEFPELHFKVFVAGPPEDTRGFPEMFSKAYCTGTTDPHDADLVVFTGGPDVDPAYYGAKRCSSTFVDDDRDYADIGLYMTCLSEGIPMFGVCRGAQFLAAMNGFSLVQDLDGHNSDHAIFVKHNNEVIENVSSRHHQAVIPGEGMKVIATAFKSTYKELQPGVMITKEKNKGVLYPPDTEAFFIRDTCCIGVQGHPEYKNYHRYTQWCLKLLNEYIILNEDIGWKNDRRRLKEEFVLERDLIKVDNQKKVTEPKSKKPILTVKTQTQGEA